METQTPVLRACSRGGFPLLDEQIEIGFFYELNHEEKLPNELKSIRFVMVSNFNERESKYSLRFPSFKSINNYFRRLGKLGFQNEKKQVRPPNLDEELSIQKEIAIDVLARKILPQEFSERKTLESFWFVEPHIRSRTTGSGSGSSGTGGVHQRTSGGQKKRKPGGGGGPGQKKQKGGSGDGQGRSGPGAPGGGQGGSGPGVLGGENVLGGEKKGYYIGVLQWGRAKRQSSKKWNEDLGQIKRLGQIERLTIHGVWPYDFKEKKREPHNFDKDFENDNDLMDRAHFNWPDVLSNQWPDIPHQFPYIEPENENDIRIWKIQRNQNIKLWRMQYGKHGRWGHLDTNTSYMRFCLDILEPILKVFNEGNLDERPYTQYCDAREQDGSRRLAMDDFLHFVGRISGGLDVTLHSQLTDNLNQLQEIRFYFDDEKFAVSKKNKKSKYSLPLYLR